MAIANVDYRAPESLTELLSLKAELGSAAAVLAGGTDLVLRLKQQLTRPDVLLSLKNVAELSAIETDPIHITIGAAATLSAVMDHPDVKAELPGLVEALSRIGHPSCQHARATLGGNLLLQTRCLFYNQSAFWRSGLERCFKDGGQVCLVLSESKECSSVNQSDGAPMALALSAQARLVSATGERLVSLAELYSGKGEEPFTLAPGEVLAQVRFPRPVGDFGQAYHKIALRSHIDYPLVGAAAALALENGVVDRVRLAVCGTGAAPLVIDSAEALLKGQAPDESIINEVGRAAESAVAGFIVNNAGTDEVYRRQMVAVAARRALTEAVARAGG